MFGPLFGVLVMGQLSTIPRHPKPPPPPPPLTTSIDLTVKAAAAETRAGTTPKQSPSLSRPIAVLKSGEKPQIKWLIRNVDPKSPVSDVVVHFLIQKETAAGAPIPAAPQKGSYEDSVLGTDLAPKDYTSGDYNTALYEPGFYLVEVELLDQSGTRRQYVALDIQVQ